MDERLGIALAAKASPRKKRCVNCNDCVALERNSRDVCKNAAPRSPKCLLSAAWLKWRLRWREVRRRLGGCRQGAALQHSGGEWCLRNEAALFWHFSKHFATHWQSAEVKLIGPNLGTWEAGAATLEAARGWQGSGAATQHADEAAHSVKQRPCSCKRRDAASLHAHRVLLQTCIKVLFLSCCICTSCSALGGLRALHFLDPRCPSHARKSHQLKHPHRLWWSVTCSCRSCRA